MTPASGDVEGDPISAKHPRTPAGKGRVFRRCLPLCYAFGLIVLVAGCGSTASSGSLHPTPRATGQAPGSVTVSDVVLRMSPGTYLNLDAGIEDPVLRPTDSLLYKSLPARAVLRSHELVSTGRHVVTSGSDSVAGNLVSRSWCVNELHTNLNRAGNSLLTPGRAICIETIGGNISAVQIRNYSPHGGRLGVAVTTWEGLDLTPVPTPTPRPLLIATPTPRPTPTLAATPTPVPTPRPSVWPPHTLSDLRSLAAASPTGDLSIIRRESTSYPPCQCRISVQVPKGLTNRQQVEALLHTFFDLGLENFSYDGVKYDPGGTVLLGYHKPSDMEADGPDGGAFTAGSINLDLQSGKYTMEIDVGDSFSGKAYFVSWR